MVNESIAIASLDKQRQTASARQQQQDQGQPQSADNFSWKFFEEVSSVDNQLRCDDESRIITVTSNNDDDVDKRVIINGHRDEDKSSVAATHDNDDDGNANDDGEENNSALMTTARAITHDLSALNINDRRLHFSHHHQQQPSQQQQHEDTAPHNNNKTITGNCNGGLNEADILSQHSSDIILPLQPATTTTTTTPFQFTSPTSTFKRKKLQQQLNATLNRNQLQLEATFDQHPAAPQSHKQHQHKRQASTSITPRVQQSQPPPLPPPQSQQATLLYNETTVMISGAGSIINPDTGIGSSHTITTTATKTHTLPAAASAATYAPSSQAGRYALDLVSSAATRKHQTSGANRLQSQNPATAETASSGHKKSTMGSKLTTGHNGTHTRSSTSSNNNCDDSFATTAKAKRQKAAHDRRMSSSAPPAASFIDGIETHLGLIGWRKRCLYMVLLLLMLLIVTNLVLTLWILKVMEFSPEGMGQLKIVPGGIQLTGQALIMDMLRASTIRSRHGQSLAIESSRNFSINTRDANGKLENHLFLGHDKLECMATGFRINDTAGRNLFSVNRNEVTIGAHALRIEGEGGAIFRESIQTPHIRAEPGRELRFESPTRQLELTAARDINLQSRAGGIEISALEDVKLSALDGSIRLESSKILMPNLRTAQQPMPGTAQSRDHLHRVFQLCACANGKLFLAAPHSICAGDDSTVCR